MVATVIVLPY